MAVAVRDCKDHSSPLDLLPCCLESRSPVFDCNCFCFQADLD